MEKLKLDLETLTVDSFEAAPDTEESRGTVHGASGTSEYCGTTSFYYYLGGTWMQQKAAV